MLRAQTLLAGVREPFSRATRDIALALLCALDDENMLPDTVRVSGAIDGALYVEWPTADVWCIVYDDGTLHVEYCPEGDDSDDDDDAGQFWETASTAHDAVALTCAQVRAFLSQPRGVACAAGR